MLTKRNKIYIICAAVLFLLAALCVSLVLIFSGGEAEPREVFSYGDYKYTVLENGRLVELGTHEELMAREEQYYKLFSTQAHRYGVDL